MTCVNNNNNNNNNSKNNNIILRQNPFPTIVLLDAKQ